MKRIVLSLALAVFLFAAVGLAGGTGVAFAHGGHMSPGEYEGPGEDGINIAATEGGAFAPIGTHVGSGPGDGISEVPGNPGFWNGIRDHSGVDANPLCPLNDGYPGH